MLKVLFSGGLLALTSFVPAALGWDAVERASKGEPLGGASVSAALISRIGDGGKTEWSTCVSDIRQVRGQQCEDPASLQFLAKNRCNDAIEIRVCIQDHSPGRKAKWECRITAVDPGADTDSGLWACHSDGRVQYWARKKGDFHTRFGDPTGDP